MYALNRAHIIGVLTQDPVIRKTPDGQSVGDLNIVTKYSFKNKTGETQLGKAFHTIVVWRGLADICGQYLRSGSSVFIAGRLQTDSWEDDSGAKRYKTRIVADEMIMLDSKNVEESETIPGKSGIAGYLNEATILGNLTRNPEVRQTPNGATVASMGIATNLSWKDRAGEEKSKTEFHNIVAWGELAEEAQKYLKKGRKVYLSGRIQTRSWETPDGKKKYTTEIIADELKGLGNVGDKDDFTSSAVASTAKKESNSGEVTKDMIPEINYESDVKPEDLPF